MLNKINVVKRKFTRSITSLIINPIPFEIKKDSIKTVLVSRPNHRLGNLILITPLLQELENTFPNCEIDVFVKGKLGSIVLKEYESVNEIIELPKDHFKELINYIYNWFKLRNKRYDLVINAAPNSSSGRISVKISRGKYKLFGDENDSNGDANFSHISKLPISFLRKLTGNQGAEFPTLNLKLSVEEINTGRNILKEITQTDKKVISIFTYATGDKCHSKEWWKEFYQTLKKEFPQYFVLEILPKENISQIDFVAPQFYSNDLREIGGVLANTAVFIGADSGMMHLAVGSNIPVLGLFNVSNMNKYQPYGNKNVAVNTTEVSQNEIIKILKGILN